MSIHHEKSDVWDVAIKSINRGGATDQDISNALGVGIEKVRCTLREMDQTGWVEWPVDDDGTFVPGDKADEYLRG